MTAEAEEVAAEAFATDGLTPHRWSSDPGHRYALHAHDYHKVLFCVDGSIIFHTESGDLPLAAGDRLDLPAGTVHSAVVGPDGVTCLEATRR